MAESLDKPITDAGVIEQIRAALPLATRTAKGLQNKDILQISGESITNANTAPPGAYRCNFEDYAERNLPYAWGILFTTNMTGVKFQLYGTSDNRLYFRVLWDYWGIIPKQPLPPSS